MNNLESLFFYLFFLLLSTYFYYLSNNRKNRSSKYLFLVLSFSIPMLIGGLRKNVGTDYNTYISLFNNLQKNDEIGFYYLCKFIKLFGDYRLMFFVFNFLTLLIFFFSLSKIKEDERVSVYYIYLFTMYMISYNSVRQMLSVNLVFLGYMYLKNNRNIVFVLLTLLASSFHFGSIFVIPFVCIAKIKSKFIKFILIILVLFTCINYQKILLIMSNFSMFEKYYILYYGQNVRITFNNLEFFFDLFVFIFICFYRKKLVESDSFNGVLIYFLCFEVLIMTIGFSNPYVKRMSLFFKISQLLLLVQIPKVSAIKSNKHIYRLALIIYPILFFILDYYVLMHSNIIPYAHI